MNTNLQIFNNKEFGEITVIKKEDKEFFGATDIAKALGYSNPQEAIRTHCKGVREILTPTKGGTQKKRYIPEGDLFRLIVKSKLPSAEKFEKWVFDEVLPTIRKTGGYISNADLMVNTYFGALDGKQKDLIKGLFLNIEEQQKMIQEKDEIIEHKEDVIIGLVDDIDLAEKRQILNRVVRYKGANYRDRWNELYRQFEMKYHINIKKRMNNYNKDHKPKLRTKLDYVDKIMGKIPELYDIACKLYENDIKDLINQIYYLN